MGMYISFGGKTIECKDAEITVTGDLVIKDITDIESNPTESKYNDFCKKYNKSSEKNKIVEIGNSKIYIPLYKTDLIQSCISRGQYFDRGHLDIMSKYIKKGDTVVDIGANIGNHTLYFANECHAGKIYSFEPIPKTFEILEKNIEINNLQDIVTLHNVGLADNNTNGAIRGWDKTNIGGTRLGIATKNDKKTIPLRTLDSIDIPEKINFIKIDVEAMDTYVLRGAINRIKKDKPVIEMESFPEERVESEAILKSLGYKLELELGNFEYLYVYDKKVRKHV